ncbi:MAG: M20/M25/M40 family metallo-hydrolase [Caulobacter sp.]|nr:M20/M25/M40 family metallo-hydrolase [Caulobacter sp.]
MTRTIWLIIALAGALLLAWRGTVTPPPLPASAPAEQFSAARALVDIRDLAREPHAIATPADARVRERLLARMTALGLAPRVQEADALSLSDRYPTWLAGAHVRNLIGVLPGADRSRPALLLMAHHDTVPGSPGAADDTTGVAAILEVIRALKVRGVPARDIIVLITDGEEWGLSGAEAFFGQDPLARRVGLIINMEARGGGGRANMFETGADNGRLIEAFKTSARKPVSSALAVFLYEKMPNDTDFSVPKARGMTGLNFAFIGRQFDYHSPTSTAANLDPGSVQSMGEQVLAAAQTFAFAPALPGKAPSAVYSQTFGDHLLSYPPAFGWLVWLLAGGLLMVAGWRDRRVGVLAAWPDGARGAAGAGMILTLAALLLNLARRASGAGFGFMEQRPLLAQWPLWEACLILLGLGAALLVPALMARGVRRRWTVLAVLILGGLGSLFDGFDAVGLALGVAAALLAALALGRPVARGGAWAGGLILAFILTGLLQIFLPQVAFLVAWPLTLAAFGAAATRWGSDRRLRPLLAVIAAVVCGWLGVYVHLTAQGLDFPALLGLFPFLAALALWPLAQADDEAPAILVAGLAPASLALIAGLVLLGMVRFSDPWSPRYPRAVSVTHVTDLAAGKAWLTTPDLNPWSRKVLAPRGGTIEQASLPPFADRPVFARPTALSAVSRPTVSHRRESDGRVTLTLTPPPGARMMRLNIRTDAAVAEVRLQGQPIDWLRKPGDWNHLRWVAEDGPVVLSFRPAKAGAGAAELEYGFSTDAWPADAPPLPALPADAMAWGLSGATVVIGKTVVRW